MHPHGSPTRARSSATPSWSRARRSRSSARSGEPPKGPLERAAVAVRRRPRRRRRRRAAADPQRLPAARPLLPAAIGAAGADPDRGRAVRLDRLAAGGLFGRRHGGGAAGRGAALRLAGLARASPAAHHHHHALLRRQPGAVLPGRPRRYRSWRRCSTSGSGVFNVFVVAQFWSFANDLYTEGPGPPALSAGRRRRVAGRVGRRVERGAAGTAARLHAVHADAAGGRRAARRARRHVDRQPARDRRGRSRGQARRRGAARQGGRLRAGPAGPLPAAGSAC